MTIRTDSEFRLLLRRHPGNALRSKRGSAFGAPHDRAFTLLELLVVLVILVIAGVAALPFISGAGNVPVQAAADVVAADLAYAKSLAISRSRTYSVVFDTEAKTYEIRDLWDNVIDHPIKKGFEYEVDIASDSRFVGVDFNSVDFDSTSVIKFNSLGTPLAADGTYLEDAGEVTLTCGTMSRTISIEPTTGVITTDN